MTRLIYSMYWNNVDTKIVSMQKRVFSHLGFTIIQENADGIRHGAWMNDVLASQKAETSILFCDIDCIPLSAKIVDRAFEVAEGGGIIGSAQTANHLTDVDFIYAAPSFLAFSLKTWNSLDCVSMEANERSDVAMELTRSAIVNNINHQILMPHFVCIPKWRLANIGVTGLGTLYDGGVFHLFKSRDIHSYDYAFHYMSECILMGKSIDLVALHTEMNSIKMRARSHFLERKVIWQKRGRKLRAKFRPV